MKKIIAILLLSLPFISNAEKLTRPPNNITGIGASPCSDFVSTYEVMQRINNKEEKDPSTIAGTFGAYGDFTGTFGGFFASSMMEHGDKKLPFTNADHSMSLLYGICKQNPNVRFIDIVYTMSQTAFGRSVK